MLSPRKHLDLDSSLLRVASIILKELIRKRAVGFETLRNLIVRRTGDDGELTFLPALQFLFLLGKIEYLSKNDVIELLDGNHAN